VRIIWLNSFRRGGSTSPSPSDEDVRINGSVSFDRVMSKS
jgi:hypothetical protein